MNRHLVIFFVIKSTFYFTRICTISDHFTNVVCRWLLDWCGFSSKFSFLKCISISGTWKFVSCYETENVGFIVSFLLYRFKHRFGVNFKIVELEVHHSLAFTLLFHLLPIAHEMLAKSGICMENWFFPFSALLIIDITDSLNHIFEKIWVL